MKLPKNVTGRSLFGEMPIEFSEEKTARFKIDRCRSRTAKHVLKKRLSRYYQCGFKIHMRQSEQGAVLKILVRTDRAFTNGINAYAEFLCRDSDKRLLVQYCTAIKCVR